VRIGTIKSLENVDDLLDGFVSIRTWFKDQTIGLAQSELELDLVKIKGGDLFMTDRYSRREICTMALTLGLELCPAEVALALVTQDKIPSRSTEINIGSEESVGGRSDVFMSVNSRLGAICLNSYVDPSEGFDDYSDWVFVKPRKQERQ